MVLIYTKEHAPGTKAQDKFNVMEACNPLNIPCGPILSMKELATEP